MPEQRRSRPGGTEPPAPGRGRPVRTNQRSGRGAGARTRSTGSLPDEGGGEQGPATAEERLQKILAGAGFGSRRAAEALIAEGRVRVGGRLARLGDRADPWADVVTVDGVAVPIHPKLRYFALNKPPGVTSTIRDRHAARTVSELLPPGRRVYPVGRLDRDSEGLLILTNDGELAHRLQHPSYGVEKMYLVEVRGVVPLAAVRRLVTGIELEDGPARAKRASKLEEKRGRTALRVTMGEGRKREIRRMIASLGFRVTRLVRVGIGPVRLGKLPPGRVRPLRPDEVHALYRVTGLDKASPRRHHPGAGPRGKRGTTIN